MTLRYFTAFAMLAACSSDSEPAATPDAAAGGASGNDAEVTDIADGSDGTSCATPPGGKACQYHAGSSPKDTLGPCAPHGATIPIEHIILLMQENRSFDHYLGHLKGNGQDDVDVAPAGTSNPGAVFEAGNPDGGSEAPDGGALEAGAASDGGPIGWHHLDELCIDDANHEWEGSHLEWDNGKNDGFLLANAGPPNDPTGSRAMGYYDQRDLPFYYQLASTFSISDRYFCDLLGPTFPNRLYFMAGTSFGRVVNEFAATPGRSIFTALTERQITWKVYESDLAAGNLLADFAAASAGKVVPIDQFVQDAASGALPQVAWIDPQFLVGKATQTSEHPPADVQIGQKLVYDQVKALLSSPAWPTSVMFITYDENGGLYDHVAPPSACPPDDTPPSSGAELGGFDHYGFRVPVFVVSPFAKKHFVSHVVHSHASILRFIEAKFDLPALTNRDANSDAMLDMFDFGKAPFTTPPSFAEPAVDAAQLAACTAKYGP